MKEHLKIPVEKALVKTILLGNVPKDHSAYHRSRNSLLGVETGDCRVGIWSRGVTVSTQDSESCDPSSNLGGTCPHFPSTS